MTILKVVILFLYMHNSSQGCTQKYPILSSFNADTNKDKDEVNEDTFHLIEKLMITLKANYFVHLMVISSLDADLTGNIFMASNPPSTV